MYFKTPYEEKGVIKNFSYKENNQYQSVNPIKIRFINDGTIYISDFMDDGIYYTFYIDEKTYKSIYYLTDKKPVSKKDENKYSCADLYSFHTERL